MRQHTRWAGFTTRRGPVVLRDARCTSDSSKWLVTLRVHTADTTLVRRMDTALSLYSSGLFASTLALAPQRRLQPEQSMHATIVPPTSRGQDSQTIPDSDDRAVVSPCKSTHLKALFEYCAAAVVLYRPASHMHSVASVDWIWVTMHSEQNVPLWLFHLGPSSRQF